MDNKKAKPSQEQSPKSTSSQSEEIKLNNDVAGSQSSQMSKQPADAPKVVETKSVDKSETSESSIKSIADEETKSAVVEVKPKKTFGQRVKSRTAKGCLGCGGFIILIIALMVAGAVLWNFSYPRMLDWLEEHGVEINWGEEDTEETGANIDYTTEENTVIKITSEENTVITVVNENMDSVVSIAVVDDSGFSPDSGIIDNTNTIGTGFVVDSSGLIMTNEHVVSNRSAEYKVLANDGKEYDIVEIVHDDVNDVAILKIEASGLEAVTLGNSDNAIQGQIVIAIGSPLGEYAGSVTTGVVSGLDRSVTTGSDSFLGASKTFENVIQTDAAINPGNSGGPLLNSAGEVIGINFATTNGAENISFALPINVAKSRLEEYKTYGKFLKPYVGIEYQLITPAQAQYYDDVVAGAFVRRVIDDSPADVGGILREDIITKIGGVPVISSFTQLIQDYEIGDEVEFEVFRDGEYLKLKVVLGEAE